MNLRLSILLVTVLVLFGGTFLVWRVYGTSERPPEEPWLYRIGEDTIVQIEVSHQGQTVLYNRDPGSLQWFIQGDPKIPVFRDKWSGTPLLLSGPRVNRALAETIENPAAYGLDPPDSIVKVSDRTGQSFEFHMGIPTPDQSNQYARLVGHPDLFTVPAIWAQVVNRLATEPPYLRLYQLEDDEQIVYIEVTDNGKTVGYGMEGDGRWYILGPTEVPVLEEKWGDTPSRFTGPRADQIVAESFENAAQYGLDPPLTKVRLGRATGADLEFYLGNTTPDGDHRYASVRGEDTLFAMLNPRAEFITGLVSSPPFPPKEEATPGPG